MLTVARCPLKASGGAGGCTQIDQSKSCWKWPRGQPWTSCCPAQFASWSLQKSEAIAQLNKVSNRYLVLVYKNAHFKRDIPLSIAGLSKGSLVSEVSGSELEELEETPELHSLILRRLWIGCGRKLVASWSWSRRSRRYFCSRKSWSFVVVCFFSFSSRFC